MAQLEQLDVYLVGAVFMLSGVRSDLLDSLLHDETYAAWREVGIDDTRILNACKAQIGTRDRAKTFQQMNSACAEAFGALFGTGGGCDPPCRFVTPKLASFLRHLHDAAHGG